MIWITIKIVLSLLATYIVTYNIAEYFRFMGMGTYGWSADRAAKHGWLAFFVFILAATMWLI